MFVVYNDYQGHDYPKTILNVLQECFRSILGGRELNRPIISNPQLVESYEETREWSRKDQSSSTLKDSIVVDNIQINNHKQNRALKEAHESYIKGPATDDYWNLWKADRESPGLPLGHVLVIAEEKNILSRTLQMYILCRLEQTLRECDAVNIPIPENVLLLSNCFEFRYRKESKLDLELRLPDNYFGAQGDTLCNQQRRHAFLNWLKTAYIKSNAPIADFPDDGQKLIFGEDEMAEIDKNLRSVFENVENIEHERRRVKSPNL